MFSWDEAAFFTFLLCLIIYVMMMVICKRTGKLYNRASIERTYKNWVDARIDELSHLVTIQAIRNSIMSNSIFISGLLLFLSLIIGLFQYEILGDIDADFLGSITISVGIVQIVLIGMISIFSLFNFVFSIRMLYRSQFLITANTKKREELFEETYKLMQKSFAAAQNYWTSGIRGLYFLIPAITWLFHPIVFLLTTILITVYLIGWHDLSFFSRNGHL
ncbi:MAG: DUF599 domain-containing protein [Candidatus Lokiarchaeota archaeon]|nr:DUF599 domain-containing protein [Candidatus Lokiarchaeota archaeon]